MRDEGLQLEHAGRHRSPATLDEVNGTLAGYGARLWALDLSGVAGDEHRLLSQPVLSADERATLLARFLLSRERLLDLIASAGREPQVPGGGALETRDTTHGVPYPELYLVAPGVDYSRFDRLHVNAGPEGTGVDETLQMLSGRGVRFVQSLPDVGVVTVHLDCPSPERGWLASYSGARPHIASFTGANDGTKVLMQIIGPARWTMTYVDGSG